MTANFAAAELGEGPLSPTAVASMTPEAVADVLDRYGFVCADEDDLQEALAGALRAAGAAVEREVRLNARDRVDILIGRLGIEVKFTGGWRAVERQLRRYLESPLLDAVLLVTVKSNHRRIEQGTVGGKRLCVYQLTNAGL